MYKGQEYVFSWYKQLRENKPFQDFLKQCGAETEKINSCVEPVWAKKLFNKIRTACYNTNFFYKRFWIIVSNQPKLRRIVNNYRRHQHAKRLFQKIS